MKTTDIEGLMSKLGLDSIVEKSRLAFFDGVLSELRGEVRRQETVVSEEVTSQLELATALERLALEAEGDPNRRRALFDQAFLCRRTADLQQVPQREVILHYLFLCADGLLAERRTELIMLLRQFEPTDLLEIPGTTSWPDELLLRTARAFVYLCRKGGGWDDVRTAGQEVNALRRLQGDRETAFLAGSEPDGRAAALLLARYNLARVVDLAANYQISGAPSDALVQIDRHASNVGAILELVPDSELAHTTDLLRGGAAALVRSSIWYTTRTLGARIRAFVDLLTSQDRANPVLELWPSQRTALTSSLLDPARRAIVIEMPTSAGKTLLAEFAAVQALALNPESSVAYVVPTRALVNQITQRLRADLAPLGYQVEAAVPVFELDPTEDALLRQPLKVLVATPEKLDLLVRERHPSVADLSLVVADEAHNIGIGERGARLELLLGTLKRERHNARFLLLTPFVPNGEQLSAWLGDDPEGTIQLDWKPSERIAAAAFCKKNKIKLLTLPSAHHIDLKDEVELELGVTRLNKPRSKEAVSVSTAVQLARRGGVLVLARGRQTAEERAASIASQLPESEPDEFTRAVIHYAISELGEGHPLPNYLKHGVAFHHAGLSHDLRYLLELLIDQEKVKIVCGTTTLAQGVNFPIASVIIETLSRSKGLGAGWEDLTYSEFWNIAGRAGRALRDRLGLVVFPVGTKKDLEKARRFLQMEASELASALIGTLTEVTLSTERFDLAFVRSQPAMSIFLQYLTHALRVAGLETARAELEDLLRSSLVYHQVREQDRKLAEGLVRIARRYFQTIQGKAPGYLALADGTGFSLSSVDYLYALYENRHPEFGEASFWEPRELFSPDLAELTSLVSALSQVPELTLGRTERGPFNAHAVAGIIRDWVQGATVSEIADNWFAGVQADPEKRRRDAGRYLYSQLVGQVPWGMGALQRLAIRNPEVLALIGYIPSLVFYGVKSKEAVTMRMAGVPRIAAEGLATRWRSGQTTVTSYQDIRAWLGNLAPNDWDSALPPRSALTGNECRRVWAALAGIPNS